MTLGQDLDEIGFEADAWDFESCRRRIRKATAIVLKAETAYEDAAKTAAEAEATYRHQLARHFKGYREAGKGVEESTTLARADVTRLNYERDLARDLVKLAADRIEDARDSRRSLWRLLEWARALAVQSERDERVPAERWP
jgi:hypothetical protein